MPQTGRHQSPPPAEETFYEAIHRKGLSRRDFMQFVGAVAGMLGLDTVVIPRIAEALQARRKIPLVWLEFQDCAGNTESFLRAAKPSVDEIILDAISLNYHETIMAAAGHLAEEVLQRTVRESKGQYLAVVEGSIPMAEGGIYCTIGGRSALDIAREVCGNALATVAAGTCAAFGGIPAAAPNPTGAVSVSAAVPGATVINLSACPFNAANITALLVHYLTFNKFPATDNLGRPLFAYGKRIHDACERRAHFDAGQYAEGFGDQGHRLGYCLYKLGCKGPATYQNCPSVRWNEGMNWPIGAGHPCVGCAEPYFWDTMTPFYERLPKVAGFGADVDADALGVGIVAGTAAAFTAHGILKRMQRRALERDEKAAQSSKKQD
ncbi:MAG TPA: hydrogenase small subunit [Vicinamibacteria bacterium]|nr:hydrogenase small subunit [Vicinamibacteria bacterium]